MKIIKIICLFAFSALKLNAQFSHAQLKVIGLTCSMCSKATYQQLKTINFIDSIGSDLNTATFTLYFSPSKNIDASLIKKKVTDAGFNVGELTLIAANTQQGKAFVQNTTTVMDKISYQKLDAEKPTNSYQVYNKGFVTDKEFAKLKKAYPQIALKSSNIFLKAK